MEDRKIIAIYLTMALTIATFNANGMRDLSKVKDIFGLFKSLKLNIICLQETFWDDSFINDYVEELWEGSIYFANCETKHRAGVAILISKNTNIDCTVDIQCNTGRLLKLCMQNEEFKLNLYNLYAYNATKDRNIFFHELENIIDGTENNIIVGDFNVAPDPQIDRRGGMQEDDKQSLICFQSLLHSSRSVDIWRYKNPNRISYTRKQIVGGKLKQSRIDHMLISKTLLTNVQHSYIRCTSFSDHEVLITKMNINKIETGPGLWIMNNTYLCDTQYQIQIRELIESKIEMSLKTEAPLIWWDNLKYYIKKLSMKYAKEKSLQKNKLFYDIQRKLENEYRKQDHKQDIDTIRELQNEIREIEIEQCKGAILRSKAFWAVEEDKCTKYFLGLEKYRQESKLITELYDENNSIVNDTDSILHIQETYYTELYQYENNDHEKENVLISSIDKILTDETRDTLEQDLSCEELKNALDKMPSNKSPGPDGITAEFYKMFWPELKPILIEIYQTMSESKQMSRSMSRGVITLIYKNKGDKKSLKNWRPISLLNVDYKIIAKVIANRMKGVLRSIISEEQTCCIPGRDIADNIMSIRDVIDFTECEDYEQGILLKIDQEKAFDRVSHKYMFNVLKAFNFGEAFINWIRIFYTNISSAVKCNGFLTSYFNIERSVRQGCPLSAMLYTLCAQPLNNIIKAHPNIHGIKIPNCDKSSLLYQHADDSTFTIKDDKSCEHVMEMLEIYCAASGAKINCHKTEVMFLGLYKNNPPTLNFQFTIVPDAIQILGVYVGHNRKICQTQNWSTKIDKIRKTICLWKARHLSLKGKVTVIQSLLVSRLWYTLNVTPIPLNIEKEITKEIIQFLWDKKPPKINFYTMIANTENGGMKLPDIMLKKAALRMKWIRKLFDENNNSLWKSTIKMFLSKYGNFNLGENIFQLVQFDTKLMNGIPEFYRELLMSWAYVNNYRKIDFRNKKDILRQPLFANKYICDNGKVFLFQEFISSGIICVEDIFYEFIPSFYSENTVVKLILEYNCDVSESKAKERYDIILKCIPKEWKQTLMSKQIENTDSIPSVCIDEHISIPIVNSTTCLIYNILVSRVCREPISLQYWNSVFDNFNLEGVCKNIHMPMKNPSAVELDFKILHRIVYSNEFLLKIGITDSNLCCICKQESENLLHMFLKCSHLENFRIFIKEIIDDIMKIPIYHTHYNYEEVLLFGIQRKLTSVNVEFLNFILSIARLSIYKRRCFAVKTGNILDVIRLFRKMVKNNIEYQWKYFSMKQIPKKFEQKFAKNISFVTVLENNCRVDI